MLRRFLGFPPILNYTIRSIRENISKYVSLEIGTIKYAFDLLTSLCVFPWRGIGIGGDG